MNQTLVDAVAALPRGDARGLRFVSTHGDEHYYPYEALEREARNHAKKLVALGLNKGERVALVVLDPEAFILSFLGASFAGLVPVPIFPRGSLNFRTRTRYAETVSHIVRSAGARMLLTSTSTRETIEDVLAVDTGLERIVTIEALLDGEPPACDLPTLHPDDLCFLQYTSGSTSLPKGVMVTHRNLVANATAFLGPRGIDLREQDVYVSWLPLHHDMGLISVLGALICDLPCVLLATEAFVRRPGLWMEAITKYRGTISFAPNFAYALAARRTRDQDLEGLDLRRLRVAGCGAEPINAQALRQFCARFEPAGFRAEALLPCYGMAEATLAITFHDHGQPLVTDVVYAAALGLGRAIPATRDNGLRTIELVGCGHCFPGHELRIVDESGRALPERCVGEIVTRGPSITVGYYGQADASADAYRDGWLQTGDLGYLAGDQLYICGRSKDLIVIHGSNLYPQDIEWAVAELPSVQSRGVIAFSVMRDGDETLVVCAEGKPAEATALRRAIAQKVAECAGLQVGHVAIVQAGSLPRTSSGKVQRRRTKAQFEAGELEEHS
ncbi:fatty-acyl-CoA synthase [Paraburkholderia sp. MM5496-R1]|uniref:fatty acyl-AMP ligase n=1 Tax=Paraburkholderia sp. MM5496-R1 TaxID=2991065 RepID=UPI003D22E83D